MLMTGFTSKIHLNSNVHASIYLIYCFLVAITWYDTPICHLYTYEYLCIGVRIMYIYICINKYIYIYSNIICIYINIYIIIYNDTNIQFYIYTLHKYTHVDIIFLYIYTHVCVPSGNLQRMMMDYDDLWRTMVLVKLRTKTNGWFCLQRRLASTTSSWCGFPSMALEPPRWWSVSPLSCHMNCHPRKEKILCFEWSPPWHSIHPIWHSIWHIFWHSIRHSLWHSIWLCFVAVGVRLRSGEAHSAQTLAGWGPAMPTALRFGGWGPARPTALRISPVEVRRGPQRSDSRWLSPVEVRRGPLLSRAGRWDPSRLTAIKSWQMRSSEAHCDQELPDEVRRGSLRSRAGRWGLARRRKKEGDGRRSRASDIKSNNPHLAGGEKWSQTQRLFDSWPGLKVDEAWQHSDRGGWCYAFVRIELWNNDLNRFGGFQKWGYPNSWMVYSGKSDRKLMMTRGTPMSGNLQRILSRQMLILKAKWSIPMVCGISSRVRNLSVCRQRLWQ